MASAYVGVLPKEKKIVPEEEAFDYAKEHLDEMSEDEKADFVEWFFSGNWIKKEGEIDHRGRFRIKTDFM